MFISLLDMQLCNTESAITFTIETERKAYKSFYNCSLLAYIVTLFTLHLLTKIARVPHLQSKLLTLPSIPFFNKICW